MTLSDILSFARTQSQTDSNGLTDTKGITFANEALSDYHRRLVDKGVDASAVVEAYRDGSSGVGTYLYPTDMLLLKAIELNYLSTVASDYKTAEQVDVSNLPQESFSYLRQYAQRWTPKFNNHGDWYEIFPTPQATDNLSQLIRIFYFQKPTLYVATSDTVAYPENQDTAILGWRVAANYQYMLGNIQKGDAFNLKYEERVNEYISTLGRGSQQPIQTMRLQITGFEY